MEDPRVNPLLEQIRNSKSTSDAPTVDEVEVSQIDPGVPEWNPAPDEVLYEPLYDNVPVRTAFPDGREIGFPYITKVGEEIEFLNAFAEHCSLLKVTKG